MTLAAILTGNPAGDLRREYQFQKELYETQPAVLQHYLDQQAQVISRTIVDGSARLRFSLPDRVFAKAEGETLMVPAASREQSVNRWSPFAAADMRTSIIRLFLDLERSLDPSISLCGSLLRFSVARAMVYTMLPDGRPIHYRLLEGDEIPSQPADTLALSPALEDDPIKMHVPFTTYARRFFLPQWVVIDEENNLLVNSLEEAEAQIASMQAFLSILQHAEAIAPYFVADEAYQRKRTGILGQLVNQGRALARYQMKELVSAIERRARSDSLNRGFSVDFEYFDEQELGMKSYFMDVIPAGRVMFIPAFVVLAARREYERIIKDFRISSSTRKHLLSLLAMLEKAFLVQKEDETL